MRTKFISVFCVTFLSLLPAISHGAPFTYLVNGVFDDGGEFSGTFAYESTLPATFPYNGSLSSTAGSVLPGYTYGGFNSINCDFTNVVCALSEVGIGPDAGFLSLTFLSPLWTGNRNSLITGEEIDVATNTLRRTIVSGSAYAVPAPGALGLLLLGLLGLKYSRLRKTGANC